MTDRPSSFVRPSSTPSFAAQFEKISVRSEWWFWLIALSVLTVVLGISYFIQIPSGDATESLIGPAMYVVLGALPVYLVYKGYRDVSFLHQQTILASDQVAILERVHSFEEFFEQAKPSVFRSHIANLYEIAWTHPEVNQDNLVEVLHSRLMARNRVVELFASVLITLGLIGTIVGLMIMMSKLQSQVQSSLGQDTQELMSKLFGDGGALTGLSVAYLTTLIGAALGGIILRVLTSVVDAGIMRYTAHLAELTEVYVLPSIRRVAESRERDRNAKAVAS